MFKLRHENAQDWLGASIAPCALHQGLASQVGFSFDYEHKSILFVLLLLELFFKSSFISNLGNRYYTKTNCFLFHNTFRLLYIAEKTGHKIIHGNSMDNMAMKVSTVLYFLRNDQATKSGSMAQFRPLLYCWYLMKALIISNRPILWNCVLKTPNLIIWYVGFDD